jgi:L-asparaginase
MQPKVLILQTGGTLAQQRGEDNVLSVSDIDIFSFVPNIHELADIDIKIICNVDSTDMDTCYRAEIAKAIHDNPQYDGYVVTHGTDTMVDTAAALNYMLRDVGKPIILTGSQKPISDPASDAPNNLYNAVKAATLDIGEIAIVFGNKILRGVRSFKESEQGLNAFSSPRVEPIGEIGLDIMLSDHRISRENKDPVLFTDFDTKLQVCIQGSGTDNHEFQRCVESPSVNGIILIGFGAGNIQKKLIPHIKQATKLGKPVIILTHCHLGAADMGLYEGGSEALVAGAISGGDMTLEAGAQKLMFALGRAKHAQTHEKINFVKSIMERNYVEDVSVSKRFTSPFLDTPASPKEQAPLPLEVSIYANP